MDKAGLAHNLFIALDAVAPKHDLILIDVEIKGADNALIVTVFLDCEGGIGIDALAEANRWVSDVTEQNLAGSYTLEVSSPGGRKRRVTK